MTQEDIIKLAREAGCIGPDEGGDPNGLWEPKGHENVTELMVTFGFLVAAAEREACAKLVEADGLARGSDGLVMIKAAGRIRARGNHDLVLIDEKIAAELERCKRRISDLQDLPANWDDDGGLTIDARAIQSASKFLVRRPHFCSEYKIYPTSLGGITFEFEVNGWDLSIEFLSSGSVEIFGIEIETGTELHPILFDEVGPCWC